MKKIINKVLGVFGYEIRSRHVGSAHKKSVRTNNLTLHHTVTGSYYLPTDAFDDYVANTIKSNGVFEKEVVDLALQYIEEDTVVLDLGANFGQMSILFSEKVGPNGKVYAFDADDFVYDILLKNIDANGRTDRIVPVYGAVHNVAGEKLYFPVQDFEQYGAYGSYGIDYNTTKGREIESITIDSLDIKQRISFMKIDIQGGDLLAMKGAVKTIEKFKMPILFEYEYRLEDEFNMSFQDYVDFVNQIGYEFKKVMSGHNYLIIPKN